MRTAESSRTDVARIVAVLCCAAISVFACWRLEAMPSLCPTVYPAPPECFGAGRISIAILASAIITAVALALVTVFVVRGFDSRTHLSANLGVVLATAVIAGPLTVVLSAGFAVDGGLIATGAAVISSAAGTVALTRQGAEYHSIAQDPRDSGGVGRDTPGMQG